MAQEYKNKIRAFYLKHRRMPNFAEVMALCGFKSKEAVTRLVRRLSKEGFLRKDAKGFLIPVKIYDDLKVRGIITAGWPSPAEEELLDTMSLDEFLIKNPDATYMLEIQGDSMQDAGILEGDLVLVERTANFKDGDIVVANIDDEWTVKYLRKNTKGVYLQPAKEKYSPIYPDAESQLKVVAVVKAVIRKY